MPVTSASQPVKFSANPAIRALQDAWVLSKIPLRDIIDAGITKQTAYNILVHGAPSADVETILAIANIIGFTISFMPIPEDDRRKAINRMKRDAKPG